MGQFNEIIPYAYDCEENSTLYVERQCPGCGRFLKPGTVKTRLLDGQPKFEGFMCRKDGEIQHPDFFFG